MNRSKSFPWDALLVLTSSTLLGFGLGAFSLNFVVLRRLRRVRESLGDSIDGRASAGCGD